MATKKKRSIDPATKAAALQALAGGKTLKEVQAEFKVSVPTLIAWKKGTKTGAKKSGSKSGSNDLALLKLENEYLKKRLAFFEK
jgi:transposase